MKFDLRQLLKRPDGQHAADSGPADDPDSDYRPGGAEGAGIESDYQALIAHQLRRWGISPACVSVEVKSVGQAGDGFDVFVALVRMVRWEQRSSMRLLVGLPLLEQKIRKAVRGTWLADYSHFAGLWLHASERLEVPPDMREWMASASQT